MLFIKTNL